ncbi:aminodeoxychorismate synthase component I [Bacillus lacus]|uniref:Aminodeoxychorismate synthase component I n=1 Tax=Metabacillus lacus TaxID=1983721 RepID=A0A7X2J034_9BACI|nr:anthranilate synthase component I family protein [Metabacillus lacus]MRX72978.1 aminodeoxychorismate synthase component I [Metabacillus lacus]
MPFNRVPIGKSISYKRDFFKQYQHLSQHSDQHVLLESGRGGRYTIAGIQPDYIVKGKGTVLDIQEKGKTSTLNGDIIPLFKNWFSSLRTVEDSSLPDFQGGAIGFFSYDCVRHFENLPEISVDDLDTPDLYFLIFDTVAVFDKEKEELWLITHTGANMNEDEAKSVLELHEQMWTEEISEPYELQWESPQSSFAPQAFSPEDFERAVAKIQNYIADGDVFQVNLSVRQASPLTVHPLKVYEKVREINPSPYMAYFHVPEYQIVSGSPELLVKRQGSVVSTRPIAGTRSRGTDEAEDIRLSKELIDNEKERAEHVMLVDLERNDLGRVCEYGSVEVNEFMVIEKYSHVMHIVSNVQGRLKENTDEFDVIQAVFPGGTITGAPKVRTMEIIEELEPTRRGIYTGSIGWIGYNGNMELNIVIRTMFVKDGMAYVQSGAGIVIDSNPKHEHKESLKKAKAILKAKELSEAEKNMSMR